VKFQTFNATKLVTEYANLAEYQKVNFETSTSQMDMLKALELSESNHFELVEHCKLNNINFLSSAFDIDSAIFINNFDCDYIKIASGLITDYPFLKYVASLNKKIILSTGMSTLDEIDEALKLLISDGASVNNISLLHCTTEYPAPIADVNLRAINTLKHKFGLRVGYSDHTAGINVSLAAVAIGAEIIEKHFTLDRSMRGPDHMASIEPGELMEMVKSIREIEIALGDSEKRVTDSELKNKALARKSIVAAVDINEGDIITDHMLTTKRPGTGLSPMRWKDVVGKKSQKQYKLNDLIELE
jgi:N,N'-diacetyllegionaminate synthase